MICVNSFIASHREIRSAIVNFHAGFLQYIKRGGVPLGRKVCAKTGNQKRDAANYVPGTNGTFRRFFLRENRLKPGHQRATEGA